MGYYDYLKNMLLQLGIYNFDGSHLDAEMRSIGAGLDACSSETEKLERECLIPSAEDYGLLNYEAILPQKSVYSDIETRRRAVMALLMTDNASFTEKALNIILAGCGLRAVVTEAEEKYTVNIVFPNVRGVPENFEELKQRIESLLPCHLDVTYSFVYLTWAEFESSFASWQELENMNLTWSQLERYAPAV